MVPLAPVRCRRSNVRFLGALMRAIQSLCNKPTSNFDEAMVTRSKMRIVKQSISTDSPLLQSTVSLNVRSMGYETGTVKCLTPKYEKITDSHRLRPSEHILRVQISLDLFKALEAVEHTNTMLSDTRRSLTEHLLRPVVERMPFRWRQARIDIVRVCPVVEIGCHHL